jgi:hypothetical protein
LAIFIKSEFFNTHRRSHQHALFVRLFRGQKVLCGFIDSYLPEQSRFGGLAGPD